MKAITIWRPWAKWIVDEIKEIETRTHDLFRGVEGETLAIHAGKAIDEDAWDVACDAYGCYFGKDPGRTGVIGIGRVAEARWLRQRTRTGRWGRRVTRRV